MIYLDSAASTMVSTGVFNKLVSVINNYGNPSSRHSAGYSAKKEITMAENLISCALNCASDELYFTSGATMSNNVFIQGFIKEHPDGIILYSAVEHDDIILLCNSYKNSIKIDVDHDGIINYEKLRELNRRYEDLPVLNVIQFANSETGVIQDIKLISEIIHNYSMSWLYVDATQYIPFYPIDLDALNIDGLGLSGQKIHCIKGTGLLYVNNNMKIQPIIYGSQGLIGGTPNVYGIACLGQAFKELVNTDVKEIEAKRDYLYNALAKTKLTNANTLPNNCSVIFDDINSEQLIELLSENGVCASAGSACSSGNPEPSHVLIAMGYTPEQAKSYIRFTIDENITYNELDSAVNTIKYCLKAMNGD